MPTTPITDYRQPASTTLPLILLALFAGEWIALAIAPLDRHDWLLENMLPLLGLPLFIMAHRRRPFSNLACITLFIFMALHEIGAHYTYAKVPYDDWFRQLTGYSLDQSLGLGRNSFDRLVHFLYGLLLFPLFRELLAPHIDARGPWQALLVGMFISAHAGIYEVIEWLAAALFGGDLGVAYLGTQGDEWDAQKDMAMAFLGTALALLILFAHRRRGAQPQRLPV